MCGVCPSPKRVRARAYWNVYTYACMPTWLYACACAWLWVFIWRTLTVTSAETSHEHLFPFILLCARHWTRFLRTPLRMPLQMPSTLVHKQWRSSFLSAHPTNNHRPSTVTKLTERSAAAYNSIVPWPAVGAPTRMHTITHTTHPLPCRCPPAPYLSSPQPWWWHRSFCSRWPKRAAGSAGRPSPRSVWVL